MLVSDLFFIRFPSPHVVKQSYNSNHLVAFIITKRVIEQGEELLWKYSIAQTYRIFPAVPQTPPLKKKKSSASASVVPSTVPATVVPSTIPAPVVQTEEAEAPIRCEGCKCVSPCASLKHCLTPQIAMPKRRASMQANVQVLPVQTEEAEAPIRCEGCKCVSPCASMKHCLTPQTTLPKRKVKVKVDRS